MYANFLKAVLAYVEALDAVRESLDGDDGTIPYLGTIPVILDGIVVGHLMDEDGIGFHYETSAQ